MHFLRLFLRLSTSFVLLGAVVGLRYGNGLVPASALSAAGGEEVRVALGRRIGSILCDDEERGGVGGGGDGGGVEGDGGGKEGEGLGSLLRVTKVCCVGIRFGLKVVNGNCVECEYALAAGCFTRTSSAESVLVFFWV